MISAAELLYALTMPGARHWTLAHRRSCDGGCPENAHNLLGSIMDEHKGIADIKNALAQQDNENLNELQ